MPENDISRWLFGTALSICLGSFCSTRLVTIGGIYKTRFVIVEAEIKGVCYFVEVG